MLIYRFLDIFFLIFHTALTLFNLFGWIWRPLRKINLITLSLTGISWFIAGIFYGIGYCPLTDWHWKVLHKLGHYNLPDSYIKYILDRITGLDFNASFIEKMTVVMFFIAVGISLYVNFFRKIKR